MLSDRRAFSFVQDGGGAETRAWAELSQVRAPWPLFWRTSRARGSSGALLLPDNATFLDALFGCFCAGVCAVPAHIPVPSRLEQTLPRLVAIVADARPDVVLTTRQILPARELVPALAEIPCITVDALALPDAPPPRHTR
jgi:acyl-CoA synthetase (AMP-forming)/AMP-acid ligase II